MWRGLLAFTVLWASAGAAAAGSVLPSPAPQQVGLLAEAPLDATAWLDALKAGWFEAGDGVSLVVGYEGNHTLRSLDGDEAGLPPIAPAELTAVDGRRLDDGE